MKERVDQQWMCVNIKDGQVSLTDYTTLKWTRKESISAKLWNKSGRPAYSWNQLKSYGWKCIKVNISFELPPNPQQTNN